jgi:hypothetical protein
MSTPPAEPARSALPPISVSGLEAVIEAYVAQRGLDHADRRLSRNDRAIIAVVKRVRPGLLKGTYSKEGNHHYNAVLECFDALEAMQPRTPTVEVIRVSRDGPSVMFDSTIIAIADLACTTLVPPLADRNAQTPCDGWVLELTTTNGTHMRSPVTTYHNAASAQAEIVKLCPK